MRRARIRATARAACARGPHRLPGVAWFCASGRHALWRL